MTLDHLNRSFIAQFKGREICPTVLYHKLILANAALEVVPEDQLHVRFSFGRPDDPSDDLSHWTETRFCKASEGVDLFPSQVFELFDIYFDVFDGEVECMFLENENG